MRLPQPHCHINHHTTSDNVEGEGEGAGGLTMIIEVRDWVRRVARTEDVLIGVRG